MINDDLGIPEILGKPELKLMGFNLIQAENKSF